MENLAIVTARMSSRRLPGKVMKKIQNIPTIKILYDRLKKSNLIDRIAISTTNCKSDDVLVDFLKKKKIRFYRGSKKNVVERVIKTANFFKAKNVNLKKKFITAWIPIILNFFDLNSFINKYEL